MRCKVAVIGAGSVGGQTAEQLMREAVAGGLNIEIVLYNRNRNSAEGKARDISDAETACILSETVPNQSFIRATNDYSDIAGADVVILTSGIRAGLVGATTRDALLAYNISIATTAAENIKHYAPDSLVLVITNPSDAITGVVQEVTGFPCERVISGGIALDSARFRSFLWQELQKSGIISRPAITGYMMGYHNKDGLVLIKDSVRINDLSITAYAESVRLQPIQIEEFIATAEEKTANAGFEIVQLQGGQGASDAPAAIAVQAALAWIYGGERAVENPYSMVLIPEELTQYGVDTTEAVTAGIPLHIDRKSITRINRALSESEMTKFQEGVTKMREVKERIQSPVIVASLAEELRMRLEELQAEKAVMKEQQIAQLEEQLARERAARDRERQLTDMLLANLPVAGKKVWVEREGIRRNVGCVEGSSFIPPSSQATDGGSRVKGHYTPSKTPLKEKNIEALLAKYQFKTRVSEQDQTEIVAGKNASLLTRKQDFLLIAKDIDPSFEEASNNSSKNFIFDYKRNTITINDDQVPGVKDWLKQHAVMPLTGKSLGR